MKLTVCKNLRERTGQPSVNAASVNVKLPGDTIEIKSVEWGDVIDGNGIWYLSDSGFYYWSGCLAEVNFTLEGCDFNNFSGDALAGILKQLQEAAHQIFKSVVTGYLGCGFGHKNYDQDRPFSLLVYVSKKLNENDPDLNYKIVREINFRGFHITTDVIERKPATLQAGFNFPTGKDPALERGMPYSIGGGILDGSGKFYGTRSVKVKKPKANEPGAFDFFLLTCYHVVFPNPLGTSSYSKDSGQVAEAIFPLSDGFKKCIIDQGEFGDDWDFAAIAISPNDIQNDVDGSFINDYFRFGEINDLRTLTVKMVGFNSGIASSQVKSVLDKFPVILSDNSIHEFTDVITTKKMSVKGDSGAPVIATFNGAVKLVGMVVGGNIHDDTTCILPFYKIALRKGFNLK